MSNEEFCKMVTAYDGEVIDDIKQIGLMSFNGEDLKEFIELCFELKDNGDLSGVIKLIKNKH